MCTKGKAKQCHVGIFHRMSWFKYIMSVWSRAQQCLGTAGCVFVFQIVCGNGGVGGFLALLYINWLRYVESEYGRHAREILPGRLGLCG